MGNGNHATSPNYASAVINVYMNMLTYNGLPAAAAAGADPVGNIEILRRIPDGVRLQGWTVDPSKSSPTAVDVYVNGVGFARLIANDDASRRERGVRRCRTRPRVQRDLADPRGQGVPLRDQHRCRGQQPARSAARRSPGPNPTAVMDSINRQPDGLHLKGWTVDPDSTGPTAVDVYANGVGVARLTADRSRPDVGAAYPDYGAAHGFDAVLPGVGGNVCVYAINLGAGRPHAARVPDLPRPEPDRRAWTLRPSSPTASASTVGRSTRTRPPRRCVDIYANGVGYARIQANQAAQRRRRRVPGVRHLPRIRHRRSRSPGARCAPTGSTPAPGANVLLGCRNA